MLLISIKVISGRKIERERERERERSFQILGLRRRGFIFTTRKVIILTPALLIREMCTALILTCNRCNLERFFSSKNSSLLFEFVTAILCDHPMVFLIRKVSLIFAVIKFCEILKSTLNRNFRNINLNIQFKSAFFTVNVVNCQNWLIARSICDK